MALAGGDLHHGGMRRQYTGQQRSQLLELVTGGHATLRAAAARLGVAPATAYYWLKRTAVERRGARRGSGPVARQAPAPTFVRLVPGSAAHAMIAVRVGGAEVQVRPGFDGDLLRAVVAALQEVAP